MSLRRNHASSSVTNNFDEFGDSLNQENDILSSKRARKRRLDLNNLNTVSNFICKESYCGLTLPDEPCLDSHYQQHYAQELEKLKSIRLKNKSKYDPSVERRSNRLSALQKIKERRELREYRQRFESNYEHSSTIDLQCHECTLCETQIEGDLKEFKDHFSSCLDSANSSNENEEEYVDIDDNDYEEYEWAGQKRIRSTSLFRGGLKAAGFLTIKKTREDEVLDVLGLDDDIGAPQFNDSDLLRIEAEIKPGSSNNEESQQLLNEIDDEKRIPYDNSNLICKICMSSYDNPLTSTSCWHVHCERCWMLALGTKKLCPQCKVIVTPGDLRKIYL